MKNEFDQQVVRIRNGQILQNVQQNMEQSLACLFWIQEDQRFRQQLFLNVLKKFLRRCLYRSLCRDLFGGQ